MCVCFVWGGGVVCVILFVCYGCTFMCVCRYMFCCLDFGVGGGGEGGRRKTKGVKSSVFLCFAHVCLAQDINTQQQFLICSMVFDVTLMSDITLNNST